jgi:diadenosine tetraphosphate (Ap4A) HIT family hydrolase
MVKKMEECVFCKIASGEIDSARIWEDKDYLAFLDLNPNTKGMTLVIPKKHYDSNAFNMPNKAYTSLLLAAKKIAKVLEKSFGVNIVAMVMEGTGVNHVHIKLYPLHGHELIKTDEREFFENYPGYVSTRFGPTKELAELKKMAEQIKQHL